MSETRNEQTGTNEQPGTNQQAEPNEKAGANTQAGEEGVRTNPRPLIIAGLLVILVFFGGIAAWSAFLPFAGAVMGSGTVKVSMERQTVQHLEGGIVEDILVREGDEVEAGDILVRLKRPEVDAQVSMLRSQIRAQTAKAARLRAESRMAESIDWPPSLKDNRDDPEVADVMEMENDIFRTRRTSLTGRISMHESQIGQLEEQVGGMQEEMSAQREIMETLEEEIEAKQTLFEADHIDKTEILELKRRLAESRGRAGRLRQDIAQARQKKEELNLQIANLRDNYMEEAFAELGTTQERIFELNDKLIPQLDAQTRLNVRAPVAGEVINMRVHSKTTGVIQAGQEILDIVPRGAELLVETRVEPDDITNVMRGQSVRVQLTPFNRRTTPPVMGTVVHVSADQVTRETPRGEESFYEVRIQIDEAELEEKGIYMSPGMPAMSYIETEERTILGYLLEPIYEMMDRSLREP